MSKFRVAIFSSASPASLEHFLRRLASDLPEVEVGGILYETGRPKLSRGKRIKRALRLASDGDFRGFVVHLIRERLRSKLDEGLDHLLRVVHAAPQNPNGPPISLDELVEDCTAKDISFHLTQDIHDTASLDFVSALNPDLGVIYGTRILKPQLFSLPRRGSINIHKHKVPDYRGGGAPGLWELRDDQTEAAVTVHRVLKDVDAGAILGEQTFRIDPLDTLASVGLKADLLSIDLLVNVLRDESLGRTVDVPQPAPGTVYKGFQPHQILAIERQIQAKRLPFKPAYSRPIQKLMLRTLMYPALFFRNRQCRKRKSFPVVILFHHLITDKPKLMGLPTDQFVKHIRFLKKHYRIVSLPEAIALLQKAEVSAPTVALTFDDGYAENFLCLRAVSEAEKVPVSLFVCTQKVAEGAAFQHDLDKNEIGFPALNWEQVRYFDRHDVIIGSHTRTHFDCGATALETLTDEIVGSQDDLRRELGRQAVKYFAFPKGHACNMSAEAVEIARQAYPYIFSACGGVNYSLSSASGELYRCCHPQSLWELELLMQGVLEFHQPRASGKTAQPQRQEVGRPFVGSSSRESN